MKWFLGHAFPSAHIFEIATDFNKFEVWLKNEHNKKIDNQFFEGYKYFIYTTFTHIFHTIAQDQNLGIKDDVLLNSAMGSYNFIMKLPPSSKKTILLQNIYAIFEPIEKAQDFSSLKLSTKEFKKNVIEPIKEIYDNSCRLKKGSGLSNKMAITLLIADTLFLFYHQIKADGPYGYDSALMEHDEYNLKEKNFGNYLEGYKYTVQFVWYKLLGEKKYRKKCTSNIHTANSWSTYIYNEPLKENPSIFDMMDRNFDVDKQTCFEAFFYRLQKELISPWEKKYGLSTFHFGDKFEIINNSYPKIAFKKLLLNKPEYQINVTSEEKWDMQFFWGDVEVINNYNPYTYDGLATFTTLLAGAGTLFKRKGDLDKIYVNKYISPIGYKEGNEISYAILIDSPKSADYVDRGWFLFYHCTREHAKGNERPIDELIRKLESRRILQLRTFNVVDEEYKKYILKYVSNHRNNLLTGEKEHTEFEADIKLREQQMFIKDYKAVILELITYYAVTKHFTKYKTIDWSIEAENNSGEMDIILHNYDEAFLIECKLNINNSDCYELLKKSKKKLANAFPKHTHKIEIWSWIQASTQTMAILAESDVSCISLSTDKTIGFLNHLRLGKIRRLLDN